MGKSRRFRDRDRDPDRSLLATSSVPKGGHFGYVPLKNRSDLIISRWGSVCLSLPVTTDNENYQLKSFSDDKNPPWTSFQEDIQARVYFDVKHIYDLRDQSEDVRGVFDKFFVSQYADILESWEVACI
jgi:hypothetical protein